MSAVRLYMDEDAGENAVVHGLRARGFDVLTTVEAGRCGVSDQDQLAFATEQRRSIYTFNVGDFACLHRQYLEQGLAHGGIIVGNPVPDTLKWIRLHRWIRRSASDNQWTSCHTGTHAILPRWDAPDTGSNNGCETAGLFSR